MSDTASMNEPSFMLSPKVTIKLRVKEEENANASSTPRQIRRQTRIRDCKRPLPVRLKVAAGKRTCFSKTRPRRIRKASRLPRSILVQIYNHLTHARDQVAFTLTCRRLSAVAATSNLSLQPSTINRKDAKYWYGKEHLLMDLEKWGWIPKHLKLCKTCLKYMPKNRIWKLNDGRELKKLKKVDWMWAVGQWLNNGRICPRCQIENALDGEEETDDDKEAWTQSWGEGFVEGVMVKRSFMDEES